MKCKEKLYKSVFESKFSISNGAVLISPSSYYKIISNAANHNPWN